MHRRKRSRRSGLRPRRKPDQRRGRSPGLRRDHAMTKGKRIHVLDTNVLKHDQTALFKFEENDVFLPMQVIEELDKGKKGTSEAKIGRAHDKTPINNAHPPRRNTIET